MQNIVLIGFMGVGKGTTARELTQITDKFAIDTDDLIQSYKNQKIKKIFQTYGEKYFRDLEQLCANWLANNVKNSIISTGGGFYKVKNLQDIGRIVYLQASFDWIYNRIINAKNSTKKLKKRPLFNHYDEAKKLYDSRVDDYKKVANIIIDVEIDDYKKVAKQIMEKI